MDIDPAALRNFVLSCEAAGLVYFEATAVKDESGYKVGCFVLIPVLELRRGRLPDINHIPLSTTAHSLKRVTLSSGRTIS